MRAEPSPHAERSPLSYPVFRALWLAGVVSFVGSFVQNVGEAWLMLDLTNSPLAVAMLATAFVGASLFMMLPAGVLADRYDKRAVLAVSQIVQCAAAIAMAALAHTRHVTPHALIAGSAVLGIGMAIGAPAWAALNPELLPRELVAEAVALNAVAFNLARAVGPAIGGVVLDRLGATASFLLNAASFVVVLIPLVVYRLAPLTSAPKPPPSAREPAMRAFAKPWATVKGDLDLRSIFLAMFTFTLGAGIFYALTPAFAKDTLHANAREYGVMIGMMGGGAVIGATALKRLRPRMSPRALVAGTMTIFAFASAAVASAGSIRAAMIFIVPAGVGWIGSFSSCAALAQVWAPDHYRARIVALYQMLHLGTWAVGSALGGVVAEHAGIRVAMTCGALVCVFAAITTWKVGLPRSFVGETAPR